MKKMSDEIPDNKLTAAERREQSALREARENEDDATLMARYENEGCSTIIIGKKRDMNSPAAG